MSIKDNTKQTLNSEEKFLEGTVKAERFFKKYKVLIIGGAVIAAGLIIAIITVNQIQEQNKLESNIAFDKVIKDPKDTASLAILKEKNQKLYEVAMYLNGKKENKIVDVNVDYLKQLSEYSKALEKKNVEQLGNLSMENNFLLKEFAIFNKALILTNEGKYKEAKTSLNLIQANSQVNELAKLLKHHLITKN